MFCAPGERCVNLRTYYFKDYKRPSVFDKARTEARAEAEAQEVQLPNKQASATVGATAGSENAVGEDATKSERHTPHYGVRLAHPLRPTITDLSAEQITAARMVKASVIAFEQNFEAAQGFLDQHAIPYDIDTSMSTKQALVMHSQDDVKIAYRGTKWERHQDVTLDGYIAVGAEEHHSEFKNAEEQLRLVTERFGPPSELLGYSLGGAKAISLGTKLGIHTTTFNPFLGANLIQSSRTGDETHSILRTTEDPVSLGIGIARTKKNWRVESILPHADKLNPAESHRLSNFTDQSARRPGHTEALLRDVHAAGQRAGELEMLHSIKLSQEQGHTFTEWTHKFNGGRGSDTTADGSHLAGSRMHKNSRQVKAWSHAKRSGNTENVEGSSPTFTAAEHEHFEHLGEKNTSYADALGPDTRDSFLDKSPEERREVINEAHEHLAKAADKANGHTAMHSSVANLMKRAVHPTTLTTGVAAGYFASKLMDEVDPDHEMNEPTRLGAEGVASGLAAEWMMAAAAGSVLTGASLGIAGAAGATSYLAGAGATSLTTSALESAHVDETAAEGIGAAVGGGVAGVVGVGTAIGGAALMGLEAGSLAGPVGMAIGAGLGSAIGLIGFGWGRAFGGG